MNKTIQNYKTITKPYQH